jgi:hypothetical protein
LCTVQTKEHDNPQVRINLSQITTSKEDNKPRKKKKGNYQQNGQGIIARKTQGKNKKQTESKKDHSILSRNKPLYKENPGICTSNRPQLMKDGKFVPFSTHSRYPIRFIHIRSSSQKAVQISSK